MPDEKKSLIARIAEACDAVGGIEKKGKNQFQNYDYVKAADVAKAIRHEFFTRNILLVIDEKEFTEIGKIPTKSGNPMPLMLLKCEVSFHDGASDAKLGPFGAFGTAADSGDKSVYKCKTGALKYVLRSIGLIPDEKDDPEADENVDAAVEGSVSAKTEKYEREFDQREEGEQTLAVFQMNGLQELAKTHGRTDAQLAAYMKAEFGVDRIEKVLRRDFAKLKDFVIGKIPLQDALQMSVEAPRNDSRTSDSGHGRRISEAQLKRLHAIKNARRVSEQDVKKYVLELKGPEHLADLDPAMYKVVISWLESVQ